MRLKISLTLIWFCLTFGLVWFARDLRFSFFGWPFGFWWAAQGSLVFFIIIAAVFASRHHHSPTDEQLENTEPIKPKSTLS